jgi:hypothetical protein
MGGVIIFRMNACSQGLVHDDFPASASERKDVPNNLFVIAPSGRRGFLL